MKKFNFDLQPVLDYRNHEKEDAEMELSRALSVEYEIKQNLEEIANQYLELKKNMKATLDFYDTVQNNQNKKRIGTKQANTNINANTKFIFLTLFIIFPLILI